MLEMQLQAPREPGRYILEWDMMQVGAGCFADKGSVPLRFVVEVVGKMAITASSRSTRTAG
jgi:hypothetical protein